MRQLRRRNFLVAAAGLAAHSRSAHAQTEGRVRRIGYLGQASAEVNAPWLTAFRAGMFELRWVEGRDYVIDARYTDGVAQATPALAAELVATRPDLLVVTGDEAARVLAQRTKTIPIVFAISQDPVGNGIAASLRRPGGNITGLSHMTSELSAKRLQLLKEALPRVAHVALLFEPDNLGSVSQAKEIEAAAARVGLRVTPIELRQPADIEPAFKRATALGAQAYIVTTGGFTATQRQAIADRIIGLKVPSMFGNSLFVEAGGLISYAASYPDNFRRAAAYVDKIFKGANPGELPIEQPTRFELVVNMKTAKAIGLKFPATFMLRVDRVIE
jgi:putative tryptophan/tyrosine transport system substrate-binding protein